MTASLYQVLAEILGDLSKHMSSDKRYQKLLKAWLELVPSDACALLKLEGEKLIPCAVKGFGQDLIGRQFRVSEHPRLATILHSRQYVRFDLNSDLPDPYDGLIPTDDGLLHVHDCMGASLYIDDQPWGVITLDALIPGTFDQVDPMLLHTLVRITEAAIKTADLIESLERKAEHQTQVVRAISDQHHEHQMIGRSPAFVQLQQDIKTVAESDLTVLITGATGVGKELVAQSIHHQSSRHQQAMVAVNCAALPEHLVESELFGHVSGAFSGASKNRSGKFELADGGTLFLDEVGELPLAVQAKLLRAIQQGEIQRVGADQTFKVDVRIVAATNRDLSVEVAEGRFRADLFHRLSIYPIAVPNLADRREDIGPLAGYFLSQFQRKLGNITLALNAQAEHALYQYQWPGNIRELEHLLHRASLKAFSNRAQAERIVEIELKHLDLDVTEVPVSMPSSAVDEALPQEILPLKDWVDVSQRQYITQLLTRFGGNKSKTAQALGVDRGNFHRLLKRLGLS
ncbi:nitric oxide reductase transcriptional regulator NorR [Litoribrevibacter albus]|uniref:Anaerobic nitric oxide reductase transcriptional regulator n=1 Tax=Litoribrevibacter albus TaxID=1473156 RepID=A0AA37SE71_9GAMM|nr:nitric oxide reductase transcriptional regulator NorR [Litoribrevibacter albus]GLQ32958.1 anaerobic nitric oxide reductase transcriptional regulator [Litoribrevibacter albus]